MHIRKMPPTSFHVFLGTCCLFAIAVAIVYTSVAKSFTVAIVYTRVARSFTVAIVYTTVARSFTVAIV